MFSNSHTLNINIEASDMIYTDTLEYYSQVQDAAESIYAEPHGFFRRGPMESDIGEAAPARKKTKRGINALMKGAKDGEVIIKNIRLKTTGGTHEVIDEIFRAPEIALRSSVDEQI
jgi:hypothetical protein